MFNCPPARAAPTGAVLLSLLLAVLQDLAELDPTLAGTGFTAEDLTVLQQKIGGALPASFTEVPEPTDPTRPMRSFTCPHCGETFQA